MNRVALVCILIGLSASSPAIAAPLTFGAINGSDDFSQTAELGPCAAAGDANQPPRICPLTRTAFGGVPITRGTATLNAEGRVRSLDMVMAANHYDLAYQLLVGRYGQPTVTRGFSQWSGFDDGARITISRSKPSTFVTFDFPANDVGARDDAPEEALTMALILLAILAFGAGVAFGRRQAMREAKPALAQSSRQANPQISMRETLERRLREGRDLQF